MNFRQGRNITMYNVYVDGSWEGGSILLTEAEDIKDEKQAMYPESYVELREEEDYIDFD